jgi:hypothetical protein
LIETLSHNLYEQVGRKGFFSAEIFDAANRILGNVPGKKVTLADNVPSRLAFASDVNSRGLSNRCFVE